MKFEPISFIAQAQNIDNNPITPIANCYMLSFQQQGQRRARKTSCLLTKKFFFVCFF